MERTILKLLALLSAAALLLSGSVCAEDVEQTDAISREFIAYVGSEIEAQPADAISREFIAYVGSEIEAQPTDAISREFIAYVGSEIDAQPTDAISREFVAHVGPIPTMMAKTLPTGREVSIEPSAVTAVFPEFFYLESEDRSSGVMVAWNSAVTEGSLVQVLGGTAITGDRERYVQATGVTAAGSGSVRPLGTRPASLGGSGFFYTPGGTGGQPGTQAWDWSSSVVVDVPGLNNIGLLVTIWGKVTWAGSDAFIIDDGSGSRFGDPTAPGVRVLVPPAVSVPAVDTWVSVTGISSCYRVDEAVYRLLRVRKPADITPFAIQ